MARRDPRVPLENPVEPRDAATLILVDEREGEPVVLMGQRHRKHAFMPHAYVFPGGALDAEDAGIPAAGEPAPHDLPRMAVDDDAVKARALALTALRETAEETGLILGVPGAMPEQAPGGWSLFRERGLIPSLSEVHYFGRAITGPWSKIRFHARFFVARASNAEGELGGSGELLNLKWVSVREAIETLPIVDVTEFMLGEILRTWPTPEAPAKRPLFTYFGEAPEPRYE